MGGGVVGSNINPPTEIFCSTGCVQYQPGSLSDIQEMINCWRIKSDRRAAGGIFARQRGAVTVMSHAADSNVRSRFPRNPVVV